MSSTYILYVWLSFHIYSSSLMFSFGRKKGKVCIKMSWSPRMLYILLFQYSYVAFGILFLNDVGTSRLWWLWCLSCTTRFLIGQGNTVYAGKMWRRSNGVKIWTLSNPRAELVTLISRCRFAVSIIRLVSDSEVFSKPLRSKMDE